MKYTSGFDISDIQYLIILVGMPSGPADDFGLILEIVSINSLSLTGQNKKEVGYFVRNSSKSVLFGNFLLRLGPTFLKKLLKLFAIMFLSVI